LQPIEDEITSLEAQYETVKEAIKNGLSHPYFTSLQNIDQSLQFLLKTAREKLHSIYPLYRPKRGLINGLFGPG
jgi:hypothetical protein